jgi:hypothetical protein
MIKYLISFLGIAFLMSSCIPKYTRQEADTYKIVQHDTTITHFVKNAPGNRDRGVVSPSTKVIESQRNLEEKDTVETREYPDFIRVGLFESVGIIGGNPDFSTGMGLFGIHPDFATLGASFRGTKSPSILSGGLYRIGIIENKFQLFEDRDWSWGICGVEFIQKDARFEQSLLSYLPVFLKKRYYLVDAYPDLALSFCGSVGFFPSQYVNLYTSLDFGSIGGMNIKAMLGIAAGANPPGSPQVGSNEFVDDKKTISVTTPYFGIGVSFLDFVNRYPELDEEYKYMKHGAWNIGLLNFGILATGSKRAFYSIESSTTSESDPGVFKGMRFSFVNSNIAIPYLDNRLFVGTSLLSAIVLGQSEWGFSVMPIRFGYVYTLVKEELTLVPQIEIGAYPSTYFDIGARANLRLGSKLGITASLGYATGNSNIGDFAGRNLQDAFGKLGQFSNYYFGISISVLERFFFPDELYINRKQFVNE